MIGRAGAGWVLGLSLAAAGCAGAPSARVTTPPMSPGGDDPVTFQGSLGSAAGRRVARLRVAGLDRAVSVIVPAEREAHPPLIVLLHGTNGDGEGILDECGAAEVAEARGVVLLAPSSREPDVGDWDHAEAGERYWETSGGDPARNPDLLLVRATIAAAVRDLRVDPTRVYVAGHSNGAFFALLVALTMPDRVAAFATNAGGLVRCASSQACAFRAGSVASCDRFRAMPGWCRCDGPALPMAPPRDGRRPPAYVVHGTDDPTVSVQYSCALASELRAAGHDVELDLRAGEGHYCDRGFTAAAWAFFARHRPPP
jgi:poly(3-hydroxybutyrate) depolymerase